VVYKEEDLKDEEQ